MQLRDAMNAFTLQLQINVLNIKYTEYKALKWYFEYETKTTSRCGDKS